MEEYPSVLDPVLHDLCDSVRSGQGAPGLSAEQVPHSAILKNWHQLSYTKVAFHSSDSQSFRCFARLAFGCSPSASCLSENIPYDRGGAVGEAHLLYGGLVGGAVGGGIIGYQLGKSRDRETTIITIVD